MAARTRVAAEPTERVLVLHRVFDAPRELVFKAWTEPRHLAHWSCPNGFTLTHCEGDLRPGGAWRSCMRSPEGADLWLSGAYREIVEPERLVFTHTWLGDGGKPGHETLITVTFAERRGKTEMTFRQAVFESVESRDGHRGGWNECFDKLAAYVAKPRERKLNVVADPKQPTIVMTRVFDAPRRLVFKAHTSPEHIRQWWGPRRFTLVVCEMDFRPGGAWRFVQRGANGQEYGFRGVYREIAPPERLVQTFEFEGFPGHVSVETLTMIERDGKTTLTSTSVFETFEDRDGMLQSGMEEGAAETMDRLAEYLGAIV